MEAFATSKYLSLLHISPVCLFVWKCCRCVCRMIWMRTLGPNVTFSWMKGTSKTFFTFHPCSHTAQRTSLTFSENALEKNLNPIQLETWEMKSEHNSHGKGHENWQPLALFARCEVQCLGEIAFVIIQLILRTVYNDSSLFTMPLLCKVTGCI